MAFVCAAAFFFRTAALGVDIVDSASSCVAVAAGVPFVALALLPLGLPLAFFAGTSTASSVEGTNPCVSCVSGVSWGTLSLSGGIVSGCGS